MKLAGAVLALVALLQPAALAAPQDVANDVSKNVMSPFCPGVTLHDCPSDSATALRDRITEMAERGWSRDRILDELEREYGPSIRAVPPTSGANVLAWLLPTIALVVALVVAAILVRRWVRPRRATAHGRSDHLTAAERRRLENELTRFQEPA